MREGAWIEACSRRWVWIDEHASWMQRRGPEFGLAQPVWEAIRSIPNDFAGEGRALILRKVMDSGYIRMRGHGVQASFEFTCPIEEAIGACQPILAAIAGPRLLCHFADLKTRQFLQVSYEDLSRLLASGRGAILEMVRPFPEP